MSYSVSFDLYNVSSKMHMLVMGLSNVLVFVQTQMRQTVPFESGIILTIFPIIQEFLGAEESMMRTTSPRLKFLLVVLHFCLSCKRGRTPESICARIGLPYIEFASSGNTHRDLLLKRHLGAYLAVSLSVVNDLGSKPPDRWCRLRSLLWVSH